MTAGCVTLPAQYSGTLDLTGHPFGPSLPISVDFAEFQPFIDGKMGAISYF